MPRRDIPIRSTRILAIVGMGFLALLLLLGATFWISDHKSRDIERSASAVVRSHLAASRIIDDLEVQYRNLSDALLQQGVEGLDQPGEIAAFRARLQEARAGVERLAERSGSPRPAAWSGMLDGLTAWTDELSANKLTPAHYRRMSDLRGALGASLSQLTRQDAEREATVETRIRTQSADLRRQTMALLAACGALSLLVCGATFTLARKALLKLEWQREELNRVTWKMLQMQETLARRYSHELHEELAQSLSGVRAILQASDAAAYARRREPVLAALDSAIHNVLSLSDGLRPVSLDDFGLQAGLEYIASRFTARTGILVHVDARLESRLSEQQETHIFRMAQEALRNVELHANASEIHISLTAQSTSVRLEVADNGRGMDSDCEEGNGLKSVRARVHEMGGTMEVAGTPPHGLTLLATIPVEESLRDNAAESANSAGR